MILYNKSGVFLGMGNSELSLLGFEDMDEFRNYHNDIADLFVNKPGYIFKFHNFSWIEYALHSGTPNKRVLLKTKNGKEIDISLSIHEIFLSVETDGSKQYFAIELTNAPSKIGNLSLKDLEKAPIEPLSPSFFEPLVETPSREKEATPSAMFIPQEEAPTPLFETSDALFSTTTYKMPFEEYDDAKDEEERKQTPAIEESLPPATPFILNLDDEDVNNEVTSTILRDEPPAPKIPLILNLDGKDDVSSEITPTVTFEEPRTHTMPLVLNLNDDEEVVTPTSVCEEPLLPDVPLAFNLEEDEAEKTFILNIELPEESTPEPLLSFDETPEVPEILSPAKPFDIVESAEHLGLDLGTFAELLDDYLHDLDTRMNEIAKAITEENTTLGLEHVSHLQSVANHLGIGELIEHFAYLEESLRNHNEEGKLHTLLLIENVIADFKCSLQ